MKDMIALSLATAACLLFQISTLAFADSRTRAANAEQRHSSRRRTPRPGQTRGRGGSLCANPEERRRCCVATVAAPWDGARAATWKRCVSTAVEAAVQQAHAPELTALAPVEASSAASLPG